MTSLGHLHGGDAAVANPFGIASEVFDAFTAKSSHNVAGKIILQP